MGWVWFENLPIHCLSVIFDKSLIEGALVVPISLAPTTLDCLIVSETYHGTTSKVYNARWYQVKTVRKMVFVEQLVDPLEKVPVAFKMMGKPTQTQSTFLRGRCNEPDPLKALLNQLLK